MTTTESWLASLKGAELAALVSAAAALVSLLFTFFVYWKTSQGKVIVTWRLREPGLPVIDIIVKNVGAGPLYNVKVHVPPLDAVITLPVVSPHDEIVVDTLVPEDEQCTYRVTRKRGLRKNAKVTSTTINPSALKGLQLGGRRPVNRIAGILEQVWKRLEDTPVLRNAIEQIGISRPGEPEWILPQGVRGVLLPPPTHKHGIHTNTKFGDERVKRKANREVVDQPEQTLRLVIDETVSEDDLLRIRQYLAGDSEVTIHWHYGKATLHAYVVVSKSIFERPATILERGLKFLDVKPSVES